MSVRQIKMFHKINTLLQIVGLANMIEVYRESKEKVVSK